MKSPTVEPPGTTALRAVPGMAVAETFGHELVLAYSARPGIRPAGPWCARCMTHTRRGPRPVLWPCMSAAVLGLVVIDAARWNHLYPVGTPVRAYPLTRRDEPLRTRTRTAAWTLGHGTAVVSVDGYTGGIALTHVDVR